MKEKTLFGLSLLVLLMLTLVACGDATNIVPAAGATPGHDMSSMKPGETMGAGSISNTTDPMTESLKGLTGKEFEVSFMQDMVAHHQSAIDMAKLVPTNTKRAELIKLGQDIVSAQTKEISDMTGWLTSWHKVKPLADGMSAPGMMQMMGDMDKLKTARDGDFDKQFLKMMIEHHQQAVNMANLIPAKTQRAELLKLGQDIIKAQTGEIAQMQGWQKAWFNL